VAPDARVRAAGETRTRVAVGRFTLIKNLWIPSFRPERSTTEITKRNFPVALGLPETVPVLEFRPSPGGSLPLRTEKLYGDDPPLTSITVL